MFAKTNILTLSHPHMFAKRNILIMFETLYSGMGPILGWKSRHQEGTYLGQRRQRGEVTLGFHKV
jgi:hypothetical protein